MIRECKVTGTHSCWLEICPSLGNAALLYAPRAFQVTMASASSPLALKEVWRVNWSETRRSLVSTLSVPSGGGPLDQTWLSCSLTTLAFSSCTPVKATWPMQSPSWMMSGCTRENLWTQDQQATTPTYKLFRTFFNRLSAPASKWANWSLPPGATLAPTLSKNDTTFFPVSGRDRKHAHKNLLIDAKILNKIVYILWLSPIAGFYIIHPE